MSIPAEQIERARDVRLEDELHHRGVKLRRAGNEQIGPCLVCGGTDRFAINLKKRIWNCRGCQAGGDVIKFVQHVDGADFKTAIETLAGTTVRAPAPQTKPAAERRDDAEDERRRQQFAESIWRSTSLLGPEAVAYFHRRGISIDDVPDHGGLRFHPACPWDGGPVPAIVGRFTTVFDNQPRGIWRRPITGEKPKSLGPMAGCVIRLWPDAAVEQSLVIGEGVETTLAAATKIQHRGTLLQPAWAVCSAGNLRNFPVLSGVETLTVLVDNDLPDQQGRHAGQDSAATCAARWTAAGRGVIRLTPKASGSDFNDVVNQ